MVPNKLSTLECLNLSLNASSDPFTITIQMNFFYLVWDKSLLHALKEQLVTKNLFLLLSKHDSPSYTLLLNFVSDASVRQLLIEINQLWPHVAYDAGGLQPLSLLTEEQRDTMTVKQWVQNNDLKPTHLPPNPVCYPLILRLQ